VRTSRIEIGWARTGATILALGLALAAGPARAEDPAFPPVYVTVAGHLEDNPAYASSNLYPVYRSNLLAFADFMVQTGIVCNLQVDYEFFEGTRRWETDDMRAETGGLPLFDYLTAHCGFEIDAHQEGGTEEGLDNYADVHYVGGLVCTAITETVGGLVWNDPAQFAQLATGENGWLFPAFEWFPEILTLAVGRAHHYGDFAFDDAASGVWRPAGANSNFWTHNPAERMVYVGPGENSNWGQNTVYLTTPAFVRHLVDELQAGNLPTNRMFTASLAIPQGVILTPAQHVLLADLLDPIAPYVASGLVRYVTYTEAVAIWQADFAEEPNVYHRSNLPVWASTAFAPDEVTLSWKSLTGRLYSLQSSTNLIDGDWTNSPAFDSIPGGDSILAVTNSFPDEASGFYRIHSIPDGGAE
jgi:hypothetical protein